jgi:negative regulator of flagellin synthesis FlgM
MTIDRLGPVDPVQKFKKPGNVSNVAKKGDTDSISISSEAKSLGEIYKSQEEVKMSPDIRLDRIEEVKKKLEDPNYIDDAVVEVVAERVMDVFDL